MDTTGNLLCGCMYSRDNPRLALLLLTWIPMRANPGYVDESRYTSQKSQGGRGVDQEAATRGSFGVQRPGRSFASTDVTDVLEMMDEL